MHLEPFAGFVETLIPKLSAEQVQMHHNALADWMTLNR